MVAILMAKAEEDKNPKDEQFIPPDDLANTDTKKRVRDRTGERERAASKKKGGEVLSVGECQEKIHAIYKIVGKVLGTQEQHREKDFTEEGAILSRLSEKYAIVGGILKTLDPLFLAVGLSNKFSHHVSEWMAKRKAAREAKQAAKQNGGTVIINQDLNEHNNFTAH